jgi:hypothetical protein
VASATYRPRITRRVLDGKPGEARTLRARTGETGVETIDD